MKKAWKWIGIILAVLVILLVVIPLFIPYAPPGEVISVESLTTPESRFAEVNGLRVHYKQSGAEAEKAIILLHGFGASEFSWQEVRQPLAGYGYVIAYDRPAFGLTERPMPGEWQTNPYSQQAQIDIVIGLMDKLAVDKAVLIGNSAGGTVALSTALVYPERVAGLVLVDAAVFTSGGTPAFIKPLLRTPQMQRLGPYIARQIQERGDELIRRAWHDPSQIPVSTFAGYRKPLQTPNWDRALWELTLASEAPDFEGRLDDLEMPVLVVTGDDDRIVPTEQSIRLAGEIPGAELVVFESCGHVPQEECPRAFMEAVGSFLERLGF